LVEAKKEKNKSDRERRTKKPSRKINAKESTSITSHYPRLIRSRYVKRGS